MNTARCNRFQEDIVGLLEGNASEALRAHIASCDTCRDRAHALEQVSTKIAKAGDDFVLMPPLASRLSTLAQEVDQERTSETRVKTEPGFVPAPPITAPPATKSKKAMWLLLAACLSIGTSAVVGVKIADHQRSPSVAATRAWHGKVAKIKKSGADSSALLGLTVATPSGNLALSEGAEVKAGMHLITDSRTRAQLALDDGSVIVLDRASDVTIDDSPRTLSVADGAILADVAHLDQAPSARVKTPSGEVKVLGTKFTITAATDRTNVEVLRGEVEVVSAAETQKVAAGQEGVVGKDGKVDVAPVNDLAQRAAFGEQLISTHNEDAEAPASGLGELRAKRPGRQDEKDHAVSLQKHAVKVRIAGNVARTEIDETFSNDTDDELEGIYRFPLPPGAQIERLALEVDGKLLDGEFVDKAKAAAIWRGAIQNAAPKAPRPREEIVWVPGPWHDPALLEWQRGGRFELRIFPIPKRGSRRVVIAYTETVTPTSGVRRYVYPLPQGASSSISIGEFSIDAQVLGHNDKLPVRARGYELSRKTEGGAERLSATMNAFVPSGDLAIEYALDDKTTDATAWAYRPEPSAEGERAAKSAPDPIGQDPFVAIALRPKLPKWSESKPRDQVIVVDVGRAMYGERFARAKRLAVQMTQEMDRRDRVTVMACDVSCKTMPQGFVGPGAPSAHDVDAFLTGVVPDGASDLVAAVRSATKATGHDSARDLRVTLLSDGVATAGYRSAARVATEVGDSMTDGRVLVVTVPIGADADVSLLGEIARGGGGVVIPYQPGQRLESTALEVLNATYGTTLRDVEVVLPDGLRDVAPQQVAPLRAGSETMITARMSGDSVRGDVIVRGKVGGDPFEAKYPIEVRATTNAGNAFVPRLFAAARIADRERQANDVNHAELVAFSRRFSVPSKTTSLLVLESEAMFKAFGIERAERGAQWTGEALAQGSVVTTITQAGSEAQGEDLSLNPFEADDSAEKKKDAFNKPGDLGAARGGGSGFSPPAKAAPAPAPTASAAPRTQAFDADEESRATARRRAPPRGGRFMKKIFVRRATLSADASPSVSADKIVAARAAVEGAPDERAKHKELAKVLALSGQVDELAEVLEKWSARDPLDGDVIVGRADVAARRGDREGSLRILGGALAASALSSSDAFIVAQSVARSYDRLGRPEACAFHVTAGELRPTDPDAVARAVSCERAQGRSQSAERWLSGLTVAQRTAATSALSRVEASKTEATHGDVVVSAKWSGDIDLDLAILDPSGHRASGVTRMKGARVEGALARDHETVALSSSEAGVFAFEIVRAKASENNTPVSGTVTVRAAGQTSTFPFTLVGPRMQVGRAEVRWEQQLVPLDDQNANPIGFGGSQPFDRTSAAGALAAVGVQHCASTGQIGTGHVTVTFSPTGRVSNVVVDDANFAGTPAGRCVQTAFFNARVAPFVGGPASVGKSFTLGAPLAR